MTRLEDSLDRLAVETGFSGVVRVDRGSSVTVAKAYGLADRANEIPNDVDTRFAIASGVKGLTALTMVSLIEEGRLQLDTTARSVLGDDLPLIDDRVTVEHLLAHRSGIGDYVDEELERPITDHVLKVPPHEFVTTEDYVRVLDGFPTKFPPDHRFSYCNSGYVVLALIAERLTGTPFHDLVAEHVCRPARMPDTEFLRSDELPGNTAVGYLDPEGFRTNVLHLPVRGSGDGGIYSTASDVHMFWEALFSGRVVPTCGSRRWCVRGARDRTRGTTAWDSGSEGTTSRSCGATMPASRSGRPTIGRNASRTPSCQTSARGPGPLTTSSRRPSPARPDQRALRRR